MTSTVRLAAEQHVLGDLVRIANDSAGFDGASEPSTLDSSRALNAGLTADDLKVAFEIATLSFKTGAALFVFLKALRDYLCTSGHAVAVSDPASGKLMGKIEKTTTDADIQAMTTP